MYVRCRKGTQEFAPVSPPEPDLSCWPVVFPVRLGVNLFYDGENKSPLRMVSGLFEIEWKVSWFIPLCNFLQCFPAFIFADKGNDDYSRRVKCALIFALYSCNA